MSRRPTAALLALGLCGLGPAAHAGWSISGDVEHFRWRESTTPSVTETGPLFGLGLQWTQDRPAGWGFRYQGRLYFGSVDYNGSLLFTGEPVTGTTDYSGFRNEAQAVYRVPGSPWGGELVTGLGYDYWERELTSFQREDYRVLYLRLGAALDTRTPRSWYGAAGVKLPLWVDEDGHFPELGFAPNPHLEPQGRASFYAELGYRFSPPWSLSGYYESYRFGESNDVSVVERASGTPFRFFQPASSADMFGLRLRYSF